MKKLIALAIFGAGYVLGTRDGRERYEQIRQATNKVKNDPRVQAKAQQAADTAKQQAPVVKDKVGSAASSVKDKATSSSSSSDTAEQLHPDSTHFQDDPFPKGDLP